MIPYVHMPDSQMRFLDAFLQALRLFPLFLSIETVASPKPLCWKTSARFSVVAASQNEVKMLMGTSCFWAWHLPKSLVQFSMPSGHKRRACYRVLLKLGMKELKLCFTQGPGAVSLGFWGAAGQGATGEFPLSTFSLSTFALWCSFCRGLCRGALTLAL